MFVHREWQRTLTILLGRLQPCTRLVLVAVAVATAPTDLAFRRHIINADSEFMAAARFRCE